jgi:CelD/BcsL family acetyltransferase involved in cellulose biosynthesis
MMLQSKILSLPELTQHARQWDDLWSRSETGLPSHRASGIELWCRSFAPKSKLHALVLQGQFVAALPLVEDKSRWPVTILRLTSNCTVCSGDLLVDPNCDTSSALDIIASQLARLPGMFVALEGIPIQSERWQQLIDKLRAAGREMHVSPGHDVGVVDILHDWDAYTRSWSSNHRSAIKRSRSKLEAEGTVSVERMRQPTDDQLRAALEACFAIENKGWKGENGTSILSTPGLGEYYHQEARMMRDLGMLDLWLLKLNDEIIAFEYCHFAKGTCFSHKISFDPDYDRFSPGRVLRCLQLEQYHNDGDAMLLDTLGVLCEAKAKWTTRSYKSSRCFLATKTLGANIALRSFKAIRNYRKKRRTPEESPIQIQPGAEKYLEIAKTKQTISTSGQTLQESGLPHPTISPILSPPITHSFFEEQT